MSFDPSVIGDIGGYGGDPIGAIAKGISIKDAMDREQLNSLQLHSAKQEAQESQQVKSILQDSKYDTPQGLSETAEKVNRVSPRAAMDLLKTGQQYQSGQIQNQLDQWGLVEKRHEIISSEFDPIVAEAQQIKNNGGSDLDANAFIAQRLPGVLQKLRQPGPDGQPILPDAGLKEVTSQPMTLARLTALDAQGKQSIQALKERIEQFKADTGAKSQADRDRAERTRERSEDEKERSDRVREAQGDRRTQIAEHKAAGFDDRESELLASLADRNVSLPAGLRSQQQIKSTIDGLFKKHPDLTADQIADGIRSGKLKLTAETAGARTAGTQIGKVSLAANELDTFGTQVLDASKALKDLPRALPVGLTVRGLMQMGEKQASNTGLLTLRLKLQALNNAYDQLSARGGTDAEKRAHIHELFDSRLTDEGIQSLVKGVREEAEGARQAANRTIAETSDSEIPGTGDEKTPPKAAPSAPPAKGKSYQHASGATVEILSE
jgi:hypothetical protein